MHSSYIRGNEKEREKGRIKERGGEGKREEGRDRESFSYQVTSQMSTVAKTEPGQAQEPAVPCGSPAMSA